jgi:Clp amino terminal domain, pathogenicity island component
VLERFSDEARTAVDLAQAEARRLGHDHVGTEHLLLGILTEGRSRAARALIAVGVTPSACRQKVAEAVGNTTPARRDGELDLTERARRSLQRAVRLANRQREDHVEPEHVLLSVIQVEGRAGQVLRGLGVDPARVRAAVADIDQAGDGRAGAPGSVDAGVPARARTVSGPAAAAAVSPDAGGSPAPAAPGSPGAPGSRPARSGRGGRASRAAATAGPDAAGVRLNPVPAPVCPDCGVALDGSLAHRGLVSRGEAGDLRAFVIIFCGACGSSIGVANA